MSDRSGVSRGDRNRNARLPGLRAAVPLANAIVGIDLADSKQMVVVTDKESRVLARRTFRRRAWELGVALDWGSEGAAAAGFAGATVAVEPTGHRWRVVGQMAAERGMPFVCVQPLMSAWARRAEDLTFDKTDDKDAVLITRLTAQLRCYLPEAADAAWARLRHLGVRRARLVAGQVAQVQQMRDLLECCWPAVLDAARQPFKSTTWHAALTVALSRAAGGDLNRVTRLGQRRFDAAVRRQVARWDAVHPWRRIIGAVFTACADPAGVPALRTQGTGRFQRPCRQSPRSAQAASSTVHAQCLAFRRVPRRCAFSQLQSRAIRQTPARRTLACPVTWLRGVRCRPRLRSPSAESAPGWWPSLRATRRRRAWATGQ